MPGLPLQRIRAPVSLQPVRAVAADHTRPGAKRGPVRTAEIAPEDILQRQWLPRKAQHFGHFAAPCQLGPVGPACVAQLGRVVEHGEGGQVQPVDPRFELADAVTLAIGIQDIDVRPAAPGQRVLPGPVHQNVIAVAGGQVIVPCPADQDVIPHAALQLFAGGCAHQRCALASDGQPELRHPTLIGGREKYLDLVAGPDRCQTIGAEHARHGPLGNALQMHESPGLEHDEQAQPVIAARGQHIGPVPGGHHGEILNLPEPRGARVEHVIDRLQIPILAEAHHAERPAAAAPGCQHRIDGSAQRRRFQRDRCHDPKPLPGPHHTARIKRAGAHVGQIA